MQPIVRRLRPSTPLPGVSRRGPLPTHLLFSPGFNVEEAPLVLPQASRVPASGRRRTSVLLFLEKVLCLT